MRQDTIQGISLLLALVFMYVPIPFVNGQMIAMIVILVNAILEFVK
jgi:hypothetical protein